MLYEVIIDEGETPNKCTIAPLAYRSDFRLFHVKGNTQLGPLSAPLLLHPDGQCLTKLHSPQEDSLMKGIAAIDCVWRRLDLLLKRIQHPVPTFARIPDGFETAYPRKSKKNTDPTQGLATIEAIFIASALLGKWDPTLFSEYYFGRKFVEINAQRFLELGISQASQLQIIPVPAPPIRDSLRRRRNRGKLGNSD